MKNTQGSVYCITNTVNGKKYVGKTTGNINTRLSQHIAYAYSSSKNTALSSAILKHGASNFTVEILEKCDISELNEREISHIKKHDTYCFGYNMTVGGDGGINKESIEKCSIPIICLNTDKEYKSCREAGRDLNMCYKLINSVCRGHKRNALGYVFEYDTLNIDYLLDFRKKRSSIKPKTTSKVLDLTTNTIYDNAVLAAKSASVSDGTVRNHCQGLVKNPRFRFNNINNSLLIGDYHSKISNLKDSESLMDFIIKEATSRNVDAIFFMGDQLDTHAVIRMEVLDFWNKSLRRLSLICPTFLIVGNHDMKGDIETSAEKMNSMSLFKLMSKGTLFDNITIIDKMTDVEGILISPYYKSEEDFIEDAKAFYKNGCENIMLAHQTFTGAVYENGQPAEDSVDPDLILQKTIISGHIHKEQQTGKCFYLGTPKWDKISDHNEEKGIWYVEFNNDKTVKSRKKISTEKVVSPIYKFIVMEGEDVPPIKKNSRTHLEFRGKSAWIKDMKKKYKMKARVKGVPTDRKVTFSSGSENYTLDEHIRDNFDPIEGVLKDEISKCLRGLHDRRIEKEAA